MTVDTDAYPVPWRLIGSVAEWGEVFRDAVEAAAILVFARSIPTRATLSTVRPVAD